MTVQRESYAAMMSRGPTHEYPTIADRRVLPSDERVYCYINGYPTKITLVRTDREVWLEMLHLFGHSLEAHRRFETFLDLYWRKGLCFSMAYGRALTCAESELPEFVFEVSDGAI